MMNLYRNRQFRWIFCLALSLVFSALFLPEARAWSGETWGPLSRGQIVERAEEMIGLSWSPNRGIHNYRSSVGYTVYNSYITYTGLAYSQNNPQENLAEFSALVGNAEFNPGVAVRVAASSLNMRSGPGTTHSVVTNLTSGTTGTIQTPSEYYNGIKPEGSSFDWYYLTSGAHTGWCAAYSNSADYLVLNQRGFGNDCSGFASICWRLPSRYTTWTFEHDASNSGGYVDSLGAAGTGATAGLIRGDALNDDYNHIVLFNRSPAGGQMEAMEQTPTTARFRTWYWSSLSSYRPIRRRDLTVTPPPTPPGGTSTPVPPKTPTPKPPATATPPPAPTRTPASVPTPPAAAPPGTDVVLNEIMPNPATDYWTPHGGGSNADGRNQYIEIYNAGESSVDICGWQLKWNGYYAATIDCSPATENFLPDSFILLVIDDSFANQTGPNIDGYRSSFTGSFSLNNTGGYIISLHDAADAEIDSVTLPTPASGYGDDLPYYRNPDGGDWVCASHPSEGSPKGYSLPFITPTPVPTPVPALAVLNEIMPNPKTDYWTVDGAGWTDDTHNEYIEIYNLGPGSVDISDWMIKKDNSVSVSIDATEATRNVPAGGHILLVRVDTYAEQGGPNIAGFRSAHSGSWKALNNDGTYVISLHDAEGTIRDSATLPLPPGSTYQSDYPYYRGPDGGDWIYASSDSEWSPTGYGATVTPTATPSPSPVPTAVVTPPPVSGSLRNPGFEENSELVFWTRVGTASAIIRSSAIRRSGAYSCRLSNHTSSYSGREIVSSPVTVIPGRRYDLSGHFYLVGSGGEPGSTLFRLRIRWLDVNHYPISTSPGTTGWSLSAFNTWEKVDFPANLAPATAAYASLLIECRETANNGNDAYLDDFTFSLSGAPSPPPTRTPAVPPPVTPTPPPNLEIYCVQVGLDASDYGFFRQGDSTLVISPDGTILLIDGGAAGNFGANSVLALLDRIRPEGGIDYYVTTHWDGDHSGGLKDIAAYNSGQYYPAAVYDLDDSGGPSYDEAFDGIRTTPSVGDELDLGGGCTALFVSVDGHQLGGGYVDPADDANARSIGLLIRYGGFDYLTLGDLTGPSAYHSDLETPLGEVLADAGYNIDVLHVSHHGSGGSTGNQFVAALEPEYAVISCGNNNGYGHPSQYALNRLNGLTWDGNPYWNPYPPVRVIYTLERGDPEAGTADNVRVVGEGSSYNPYDQGSLNITVGGGGSWYAFAAEGPNTNTIFDGPFLADEGPLPEGAGVVINQVCPFGSPGEFVELYNPGGFSVSLAGWTLDVYSGDYVFSSADTILPRSYFLISDISPVAGVVPDAKALINITDNGANSFARLLDGSGRVVDAVGWKTSAIFEGTRLGTLAGGQAWKRKVDGVDTDDNSSDFVQSAPDPRAGSEGTASVLASGDYNGDGRDEIAVFRSSTGLWAVRGVTRVYFGGGGDIPVSGDYDGDGTAEIAIFRGLSGLWAVRGVTRAYFGGGGDTAVPGDYSGDGSCDIGIFRPSAGLWAIRGYTRLYFGASGDQPLPGSYKGDGRILPAVFRPGSGLWALRGVSRVYFGTSSDRAVPGDYNGDATWTTGIFRPSTGLWALRGHTRAYFGGSADLPVPADYGGTGSDAIGIYRPASGLWAIRGITRTYFGSAADRPVTR
ncbi:MAG: lamin tail domain-containing protein [Candidatus Erginobacter occultus]|nr:lamin tail domain-containing protein [Candidatus Erginobacter occultus]